MSKRLIVLVGISGSGKSTFVKGYFIPNDTFYISPDMIRKELTGNISDQSRNVEVWETAYNSLDTWTNDDTLPTVAVFDSTACNLHTVKTLMEKMQIKGIEIVFYVLPISIFKSYWRIRKDLKNKIDRAATPLKILFRQKKRI